MIKKTLDGNTACAKTAYLFTEIAGIYPITPSSPMAEHVDELSSLNYKNAFGNIVKVYEMQSEAGAAGFVHGALQSGVLASTYTASQGLLLMIPNMYKIAGEMLPFVMHVAARSLSTHALSIMGDHQDIYSARQTGFAFLASSSPEEAGHMAAISHLSTITSSIPFLHFFDGFRTSHEIQKVNLLELKDIEQLIDKEALNEFRKRSLSPLNPVTRGMAQNDDIYFQATEVRNQNYTVTIDVVDDYMKKINKVANTDYQLFNYYGHDQAENIIVAMGSACETIKETINDLNNKGYKVGLIQVHLYRPFSIKHLKNVIPATVKNIAVLDRTKEHGSIGEPLYLDVLSALKDDNYKIIGGRYGLSSKNTAPKEIKAVYDNLLGEQKDNFTIGIEDDVTNLSLKTEDYKVLNHDQFLFYGYGSDGMISSSKSILKILGDNYQKNIQGYFQYDSKKSGSITASHIRVSDKPIESTYYIDSPKLIFITKDSYLNAFNPLENIDKNGIVVVNTNLDEKDFISLLNDKIKSIILTKNIKLYIIDATKLSKECGIKDKLSTIFAIVFFKLTDYVNLEDAKNLLKEEVEIDYFKRDDIILSNKKAIDEAVSHLRIVNLEKEVVIFEDKETDFLNMINTRKGDDLKVSDFLDKKDGTFIAGTTKTEKRNIADAVPSYDFENCIQCNLCSFVCPHAVIRPFLLDEEEYKKAPLEVQKRCTRPMEPNLKEYYYTIGISALDCTGCGLCVKVCPGKGGNKALNFKDVVDDYIKKEARVSDYLFNQVMDKNVEIKTVKSSQFTSPKFEFSGACAGCGETPYLKLLTQLFGKNMVIANATGCSSIYGGSMPSTPYTVPWASSLFEDNAEYGYGMLMGYKVKQEKVKTIIEKNIDNPNQELLKKWLENYNDYEITKEVYDKLDDSTIPSELKELKEDLIKKIVWTIGGDGWAYDIGFGGIDHVVSTNEDINILVLDSQVYSNTGGQVSKSSPKGSMLAFAKDGKRSSGKDMARMLMAYPHVYVAQVNIGANPMQLLKALKEAAAYDGPSVVIAYTPCIAHGIDGGLENSLEHEKNATKCGYFPIFRYNPTDKKFYLDSKEVNFDLYIDFLNSQRRFKMLKAVNEEKANQLFEEQKNTSIERFNYYKELSERNQ